jgi:transaldolase/glucose-6-phosphate isomerase
MTVAPRHPIGPAGQAGQTIWYDDINRALLLSGRLQGLIEQGITGVISDPTTFERAITGSGDYEESLRRLVEDRRSAQEIYEELVLDDIRAACDLLLPAFQASDGADGRVSLAVLPELSAHTEQTVADGLRLAHLVGRPNVMIAVPATPEGIPAVRSLTAQGVSVHATLIFSLAQYDEVSDAYLLGLEDRLAAGGSLTGVASVAGLLVSPVDTACDQLLTEKIAGGTPDEVELAHRLLGRIAVANANLAYDMLRGTLATGRWTALAARGAKPQRLLWASTAGPDARRPPTSYLDALIGRDTVSAVSPLALSAFIDGPEQPSVAPLGRGLEEAYSRIEAFGALGLDLSRVCRGLLADGVKVFAASMSHLMGWIAARRAALLEQLTGRQRATLPPALGSAWDTELAALADQRALHRLWDGDPTLFTADPAEGRSIKSRLGWLRAPSFMRGKLAELRQFAAGVRDDGFRQVVLLGMGGSSLGPRVLASSFPVQPDGLPLQVLDDTDPAAVRRVARQLDLPRTLFLVASKSGATIEIQALERYFWGQVLAACQGDAGRAGAQFVAITDPATRLGQLATEKKYRRIFVNPADIGGRYSVLSYFGLVPAALLALDLTALVDEAMQLAAASSPAVPAAESPGVQLGALLAAAAQQGRDKLTLVISPEIESLGSWIEQLVAESTGKQGRGIVPIDREPIAPPDRYGADRLFVYVRLTDHAHLALDAAVAALEDAGQPVLRIAVDTLPSLGREFFRWEVATALAGSRLGINPFGEPNVTESKVATSVVLAAYARDGRLPPPEAVCRPDDDQPIQRHLAAAVPGDYLALCAFLPATPARERWLARMRLAFRDRHRLATTLGFGPRYLHATGQLHKGGPSSGLYLQLVTDAAADPEGGGDLAIPGEAYGLATLRDAQALGDLQILRRRGRRVLRVDLGGDVDAGLEKLAVLFERDAARMAPS